MTTSKDREGWEEEFKQKAFIWWKALQKGRAGWCEPGSPQGAQTSDNHDDAKLEDPRDY